jgi:hypothetical protein
MAFEFSRIIDAKDSLLESALHMVNHMYEVDMRTNEVSITFDEAPFLMHLAAFNEPLADLQTILLDGRLPDGRLQSGKLPDCDRGQFITDIVNLRRKLDCLDDSIRNTIKPDMFHLSNEFWYQIEYQSQNRTGIMIRLDQAVDDFGYILNSLADFYVKLGLVYMGLQEGVRINPYTEHGFQQTEHPIDPEFLVGDKLFDALDSVYDYLTDSTNSFVCSRAGTVVDEMDDIANMRDVEVD